MNVNINKDMNIDIRYLKEKAIEKNIISNNSFLNILHSLRFKRNQFHTAPYCTDFSYLFSQSVSGILFFQLFEPLTTRLESRIFSFLFLFSPKQLILNLSPMPPPEILIP